MLFQSVAAPAILVPIHVLVQETIAAIESSVTGSFPKPLHRDEIPLMDHISTPFPPVFENFRWLGKGL